MLLCQCSHYQIALGLSEFAARHSKDVCVRYRSERIKRMSIEVKSASDAHKPAAESQSPSLDSFSGYRFGGRDTVPATNPTSKAPPDDKASHLYMPDPYTKPGASERSTFGLTDTLRAAEKGVIDFVKHAASFDGKDALDQDKKVLSPGMDGGALADMVHEAGAVVDATAELKRAAGWGAAIGGAVGAAVAIGFGELRTDVMLPAATLPEIAAGFIAGATVGAALSGTGDLAAQGMEAAARKILP
jgi:hypothetical protein